MRLLIVEDERKTREYLQQGLSEAGFVVDTAPSGYEGLNLTHTQAYDLLILDIMLPGLNGFEILKSLRDLGNTTPVLFLSARDLVEDRVRGLDLGADDYLVKPFSFSELLARVQTLLRRGRTIDSNTAEVADLQVDFFKRRVTRGGLRIDLTAKEFALLELLLRRKNRSLAPLTDCLASMGHEF